MSHYCKSNAFMGNNHLTKKRICMWQDIKTVTMFFGFQNKFPMDIFTTLQESSISMI